MKLDRRTRALLGALARWLAACVAGAGWGALVMALIGNAYVAGASGMAACLFLGFRWCDRMTV